MGFLNLKSFLQSHNALPSPEPLPKNSLLLVDASDFLFHLAKTKLKFEDLVFGGDYTKLDIIIRDELAYLKGLGYELMFFCDGPRQTRFKKWTLESRRSAQELEWDSWNQFVQFPESSRGISIPSLPTMALHQLACTLREVHVTMITCMGEADLELAVYAQKLLENETFVYALDLDFILMKNCPFIEIGSLGENWHQTLVAPVFYRREIAQMLNLSEANLLELGLVLGTDFTHNTVEDYVVDSLPIPSGWSGASVYLERARGINETIPVTSKTQNQTFNYCRSYFNASSIEEAQKLIEDEKQSPLRFVLDHELAWLQSHKPSSPLALLHLIKSKRKSSCDFLVSLEADHILALEKMITGQELRAQPSPTIAAPQSWRDVIAGEVWQGLCRKVFSSFSPAMPPTSLFHGKCFHQLVCKPSLHEQEEESQRMPEKPNVLPIDEHRETILSSIRNNDITLIHGEAGKTSNHMYIETNIEQAVASPLG